MANQLATFGEQMVARREDVESVLPEHITFKAFKSYCMTAVSTNPDLLAADRRSLFNSCKKAAEDGMLPDGREGALVIYNTNVAGKGQPAQWSQQVQWMPMIGGILKKIRQSGQVAFITARVVYENDGFDFWIDEDGEHLQHRPARRDRGKVVDVYAMAKANDGSVFCEVLSVEDIEKIRAASKSANSPAWRNWWNGMAEAKTLRKLSKRLPLSSELLTVIQRDDESMDFQEMRDVTPQRHKSAASVLGDPVQVTEEDEAEAFELEAETEQEPAEEQQ